MFIFVDGVVTLTSTLTSNEGSPTENRVTKQTAKKRGILKRKLLLQLDYVWNSFKLEPRRKNLVR